MIFQRLINLINTLCRRHEDSITPKTHKSHETVRVVSDATASKGTLVNAKILLRFVLGSSHHGSNGGYADSDHFQHRP
jgi:hypothetical protein